MAGIVLTVAAGIPGQLRAQGVTTGAVTGTVTDAQGRAVPDVQVVITNEATGFRSGGLTRSNGLYFVQGLEVGSYRVQARRIGYQPAEQARVPVTLSQATRIDFRLAPQVARLSSVTVTAAADASEFSPTRQGIGTTVSDTLIRRMPLLGRDVTDLVKLTPQVVRPQDGAASAGGQYNRYNNFQIDGANQNDRFNLNSSGGQPGGASGGRTISPEAVKEFKVLLSPTDVRQGNFSGMSVNAVTKNGTNELSGGALLTYRNQNYSAEPIRGNTISVKQYGFSLGGPIIRDRLHFFVAPEWQQRTSPAAGPVVGGTGTLPLNISPDSIAAIQQSAQPLFDPGTAGPVDIKNPLTNLFARLDYQINDTHRFVVRQLYNTTENVAFSRNLSTYNSDPLAQNTGFRLGSNGFTGRNTNRSTVVQLFSNLANGISNEIIVGYNTVKDERVVPVITPEISVAVVPTTAPGTTNATAAVTFGTEQFSVGNLADQKIFEASENLTIPFGAHTLTFGGRFEALKIYNFFAQGAGGAYKFPSIAAFQARQPSGYSVAFANSGNPADIPSEFRTTTTALYAQDLWNVTARLAITAGLRVDVPKYLDRPANNPFIDSTFRAYGVRTSDVPKTQALWSPRIGFNYDVSGNQTTQIRGNVGVFTNPPPFIMVSNAFSNTGLGLVRLGCSGSSPTTGVPAFTVNQAALPKSCAGQPVPALGSFGSVGVNVTDANFKYPQTFVGSLGFDRQLPYGVVATLEGLYRKAINGMFIRDLNIKGPRLVNGQPYTDRNGRILYADTILANGNVRNALQKVDTIYNGVAFNEGLIYLTNQSRDYNYSLSGQLKKQFGDVVSATVAYTYMQSKDVQSLTSDRAISNWRNGRQYAGLETDDTPTASYFERPHRVVAYGTWTLPWKLTDVSLYYEGMSGTPITYTTNVDLNGDGSNANDPIYVPRDARDPNEILIGSIQAGRFVQNTAGAQAFEDFISGQSCLNAQRGQIMARDSCRSPWQNRVDFSVRQSAPQWMGQRVTVQLDIFNFGNLLNKNWGRVRLPTISNQFPQQNALLGAPGTSRTAGPLSQSQPVFAFNSTLQNGGPWVTPNSEANNYRMQLTARYAF
jgi:hypothetical protein